MAGTRSEGDEYLRTKGPEPARKRIHMDRETGKRIVGAPNGCTSNTEQPAAPTPVATGHGPTIREDPGADQKTEERGPAGGGLTQVIAVGRDGERVVLTDHAGNAGEAVRL